MPAKKIDWPVVRPFKHWSGKKKWIVDATLNGNRDRRYFKSKSEAETWQLQKHTERENLGVAVLDLPDDLRREAINLNRRLKLVGSNLTTAVEFYFKHARPDGGQKTVKQVIDELATKRSAAGRNADYLRVAGIMYGIFSKTFGERQINSVLSRDIEAWLDSNAHWSPTTRLNYQRNLAALWSFAEKRSYATHNPLKRLERPTLDNKPPGILTPAQAETLLKKAAKDRDWDTLAFLAIGMFAGLRVAEVERLDWSEIDLTTNLIEVTAAKAKTRARRHAVISTNLRTWLMAIPATRRAGPVIAKEVRIDRFAERAGITDWPKNALRHSFASYHLAHHKDAAKTALEMGHNSQKLLFSNYRELVKPTQAAEFWKIRPQS